ncbi:exosome complex component CSL4 [Histomonas meleagridis]|uniref:exosome complex component CSL4 n=1 Tax=Histomonas meleagridis TaxID=135588 RepID=UPI00355A0DC3|nr:exosome complex component CSL4 [Histomonas meleagridis]KAH0799694.1 exosome complex component CSL4 [Histomonas meleagridis]
MTACLPGDNIPSFTEDQKQFIISQNDVNFTTVLGYTEKEDNYTNFHICRKTIVPKVHDIVIGRVIRAKRKEAHLVLLTTNGVPLRSPLLAELRSVDIAEKDVDSQIASQFCHPGDLVKARVVALGRSGFYAQLSTAEEGLGVQKLEKNES